LNTASQTSRDGNAIAQLDRDWNATADRTVAEALSRWQQQEPVLGRFSGPRQLLGFLHTAGVDDSDEPLLALLTLAASDRLAGRLVLQAFLPALKTLSQRIIQPAGRSDEVWELLFFYAWEAICGYPTATRRRSVAANLVLQVLHDTTRALRRENDRGAVQTPVPTTDAQALVLAAADAGVIAADEAELVLRTRFDGERLRRVAETDGVSYTALRMRRLRAERRLRDQLSGSSDVTFSSFSDHTSLEGFSRERPVRRHTDIPARSCPAAA
jgi:hypothetical protein